MCNWLPSYTLQLANSFSWGQLWFIFSHFKVENHILSELGFFILHSVFIIMYYVIFFILYFAFCILHSVVNILNSLFFILYSVYGCSKFATSVKTPMCLAYVHLLHFGAQVIRNQVVFVQIIKCILQILKYICPDSKVYLSRLREICTHVSLERQSN